MGRPGIGASRVVHLRISERMLKMLEAEAAENASMVSELIRKILTDYFKEKEEKYARLLTG